MFGRLYVKQQFGLVALAFLVLVALAGLRYLDHSVAQAGLWFFIGLALTTGFFHGALDIVLMQREFVRGHQLARAVILYAGSAMLLATVCAHSGWLLVLVLLLMSVWHFGEPYGRWENGTWNRLAWIQRAIAGGAPVMLPALLSTRALQAVLPMAVDADATWAFAIWQTLAWLWVGMCGLSLAVLRQRLFSKPLFKEVAFVIVINLLLSPLMAFSIYFGVFHATAHIIRVVGKHRQGAVLDQKNETYYVLAKPVGLAITITSLATVILLLVLIWYVSGIPISAGEHHSLLHDILVGLTAVTLPHLVLVSRNAPWLTKQSSASPFWTFY